MKKFKLLSVDDDPINQLIIEEQFSDISFLYFAFTGKDAIEMVSTVKPDIIFMDINMPGIDGYESCKQIKKISEFKKTPIIFISCLDSTKAVRIAKQVGGIDFVVKPFKFESLLNKMHMALET